LGLSALQTAGLQHKLAEIDLNLNVSTGGVSELFLEERCVGLDVAEAKVVPRRERILPGFQSPPISSNSSTRIGDARCTYLPPTSGFG